MKKPIILLITLMIISVGFLSGCNETKNPDVKIVSPVTINKTEYIGQHPNYVQEYNTTWVNYEVSFDVKDINDIGTDVELQVNIEYYDEDSQEWDMWSGKNFDRDNFYLDVGDTKKITSSVDDLKPDVDEERRIKIEVYTINGITDTYEEIIFGWE